LTDDSQELFQLCTYTATLLATIEWLKGANLFLRISKELSSMVDKFGQQPTVDDGLLIRTEHGRTFKLEGVG
jgi:hypothetical protein